MVQRTGLLACLLLGAVARVLPVAPGQLIQQQLVAAEISDYAVRKADVWAAHRLELHGREPVHGAALDALPKGPVNYPVG